MNFYGDTTIPANTPLSSPFEYKITITKGTITKLGVYFPWGCAGLVGVSIWHYTWQLFPLSRTKYRIGNDLFIPISHSYRIEYEPYELIVRAYNLDDTYDHTPLIDIEMLNNETSLKLKQFLETI